MRNCGKRTGSALIITLFVVFFLSAIALSLSAAMQKKVMLTARNLDNMKSLYIAKAALRSALAELKSDKMENNYDCLRDSWHTGFQADDKNKVFDYRDTLDEKAGQYQVRIIDESARLNINSVSTEVIENMISLISAEDNKKTAKAIIDYRQGLLQDKTISSIYELLNIQSVDRRIFWGEDINDDQVLDIWEDDADAGLPEDNADGRLDYGIKDFFSVYTDGKINLNTVSRKVLLSLPGISEEAADQIITMRRNKPFEDEKEFSGLPGLDSKTQQFIARFAGVRSDIYRIIVKAQALGALNYKQIIAVVDRSHDPVKILYWREN